MEDSKAKPFKLRNDFFSEEDSIGEEDSIVDSGKSDPNLTASPSPNPITPPSPPQQGRGRLSSLRLDNSYLEKEPAAVVHTYIHTYMYPYVFVCMFV